MFHHISHKILQTSRAIHGMEMSLKLLIESPSACAKERCCCTYTLYLKSVTFGTLGPYPCCFLFCFCLIAYKKLERGTKEKIVA